MNGLSDPLSQFRTNGRCEFIQEYNENEFSSPRKGEPIIESIKFITGEKLDDILAGHKAGR